MPDQIALPLGVESDDPSDPILHLRRSARARRLALRVHLDGRVEVVVPRGVTMATVENFVMRHRHWVHQKLASRPKRVTPDPFPPQQISLTALGEVYRVHLAGGRGRLRVDPRAGVLSLRGAWDSATPAAARRVLLMWLVNHARTALEMRLREKSVKTGFHYRSLQLRRQRTRWGSCSSRGVISLNVCAVFQPPEVLDYLLVHELVHTRHMNHSAAYWKTVGEHCHGWKRLDRALSEGWKRVPAWVFG